MQIKQLLTPEQITALLVPRTKVLDRLELSIDDFIKEHPSICGSKTLGTDFIPMYNKLISFLQENGYCEYANNKQCMIYNITHFSVPEFVLNAESEQVLKRMKGRILNLELVHIEPETIYSLDMPFDAFVAVKYVNKQINAKTRGIDFSLTLQDMKKILSRKTCYYSGIPLTLEGTFDKLTLDRIDCNKGYERGNVVVCAKVVNDIKNDLLEKGNLVKGMSLPQIKKMLSSFVNLI